MKKIKISARIEMKEGKLKNYMYIDEKKTNFKAFNVFIVINCGPIPIT